MRLITLLCVIICVVIHQRSPSSPYVAVLCCVKVDHNDFLLSLVYFLSHALALHMRPTLSNRSAMHRPADSSRGNVTFPDDWFRYPIGTSELLDRIADTRWYSVSTAGDGACSLHALWGSPRATLGGRELFCEDARRHVLAKVPLSWGDVESLADGDLSAAFKDVVSSKFADLVDSTVNDFEKQEFQRLLP